MASLLLIDDDEIIREMTFEILELGGHNVATASSGSDGLELFSHGHFDLIITDIVMPGVEGLELIGHLRKASPSTRIIAISGGSRFSESLYLPAAKKFGALRTLSKPFGPEELLNLVDEVMAEPPPATENPQ